MKPLIAYALSFGAASALLSGCGGSQPPITSPVGAPLRTDSRIPPTRIYVGDNAGELLTYNLKGWERRPTLKFLSGPQGLAIYGTTIYVVESFCDPSCFGQVLAFTVGGGPTTFEIRNLTAPTNIAVDTSGKIYVANACQPEKCRLGRGAILTYDQSANPTEPTILLKSRPIGVAVDKNGKIYVTTNYNKLLTFTRDGKPTTPTIKNLEGAAGVAVDSNGKIYVANSAANTVTTYTPNGKPTTPTMSTGLATPEFLAVGANGRIYVSNVGNSTVTMYSADGRQFGPTIAVAGGTSGVAVY